MTENLIKKTPVPDKFKAQDGALKSDELLKSYLELEKKLSRMVALPNDESSEDDKKAFYSAIGRPEAPDAYQIEVKHQLLASDPEVNQYLYDLGFSNKQVQAVYDLAAQRVLPVIEELAQDFEADKQRSHLINHFGSKEKWDEISHQILTWAKNAISEPILEALSTTYEGVIALYQMMQSNEPSIVKGMASVSEGLDEEGLKKMMMDPKYWKEQDPAILKKVSDGFARLYPSKI